MRLVGCSSAVARLVDRRVLTVSLGASGASPIDQSRMSRTLDCSMQPVSYPEVLRDLCPRELRLGANAISGDHRSSKELVLQDQWSTRPCAVPLALEVVAEIDGFGPGVEVQRCGSLFAEGIAAGLLDAAEGHVQIQARGRPVDLNHAGLNSVGEVLR